MQFHNLSDFKLFLFEIGSIDESLSTDTVREPTSEELDTFISKRKPMQNRLKDKRKSMQSKANWRSNRFNMLKGIKAFHRSTDGKRFHRKMGRFLATRITRDKSQKQEREVRESFSDFCESLVHINSFRQAFLLEAGYYHDIFESLEIDDMVFNHAIPLTISIEKKILQDKELNDDEMSFLMDFVGFNHILDGLEKTTGISFDKLSEICTNISNGLLDQGTAKESDDYWVKFLKQLNQKIKEETKR